MQTEVPKSKSDDLSCCNKLNYSPEGWWSGILFEHPIKCMEPLWHNFPYMSTFEAMEYNANERHELPQEMRISVDYGERDYKKLVAYDLEEVPKLEVLAQAASGKTEIRMGYKACL